MLISLTVHNLLVFVMRNEVGTLTSESEQQPSYS